MRQEDFQTTEPATVLLFHRWRHLQRRPLLLHPEHIREDIRVLFNQTGQKYPCPGLFRQEDTGRSEDHTASQLQGARRRELDTVAV